MSFFDWLPQDPWIGPPLPRFMAIVWPWATAPAQVSSLPGVRRMFTAAQPPSQAVTTYDNTETVEFPEGFDPDTFMPRKIVVHRNAKVT